MSDNPFASPDDLSAQAPAPAAETPTPDAVVAEPVAVTSPAAHAVAAPVAPALQTYIEPSAFTPEPKPAKGRVGAGAVAAIAGGALVLGALGGFGAAFAYDQANSDGSNTQQAATLPASDVKDSPQNLAEGSIAAVSAAVMPSVVSIESSTSDGRQSTGSGFVVREDGYIATNNHVVEGAEGGKVKVLFSDGEVVDATVVGTTADYDLAVLKVDKTGLTPLTLADSDALVVGDPVIAIGSPLGLDSTVTTGIVSALHRPVTTAADTASGTAFIDAIQTDAAINPGNSGGPLLDAAGQVIGVNSAIASLASGSEQAGSVGLGFAIPSNQVRRTVEELIATGTATYPVIGVMLDPNNTGEGVLVATDVDGAPGVVVGGPAEAAGIEGGDVITKIDGRTIARDDDLVVAIRAKAPGDDVVLTVKRDGKEQEITVKLASNTDVDFGDQSSSSPAPSEDSQP